MMKNVLQAIQHRRDLYRQIQTEMALIRHGKVATNIDLIACFSDAAENRPRGHLGRIFSQAENQYYRTFIANVSVGNIQAFYLPVKLALTKTRVAFDRECAIIDDQQKQTEALLKQIEPVFKDMEFNISFEFVPSPVPDQLEALYVGDFLDIINATMSFEKRVLPSVIIGDGEETLKIVRDLRNIPDYSQHFPQRPRPPGNGKSQKGPEQKWAPVPGIAQPI